MRSRGNVEAHQPPRPHLSQCPTNAPGWDPPPPGWVERRRSVGPVTFVRNADLLGASEMATLVVVDVSRPRVVEARPAIKAPTIGFGRPDDCELAGTAPVGCDRVWPVARS